MVSKVPVHGNAANEDGGPVEGRGKPDYARYLRSAQWAYLRRYKLYSAGWRCESCGRRTRLEVHHRTYQRLGAERLEDLQVLCERCHSAKHPDNRERKERLLGGKDDYVPGKSRPV
jgi:5-methylcytosine-specific restriction endonuclease McrA